MNGFNKEHKNSKNEEYDTLSFIEDLRKILQKIVPVENQHGGRLSNEKLSLLLGQNKNHIKNIILNSKMDSKYKIALDFLALYENTLKKNFADYANEASKIIEKYRNLNDLLISTKEHIYKFHPDIKLNYFKNIDTKEKAYWIGFLFADGWLSKANIIEFGVEISTHDEILINQLSETIGFNLIYKK